MKEKTKHTGIQAHISFKKSSTIVKRAPVSYYCTITRAQNFHWSESWSDSMDFVIRQKKCLPVKTYQNDVITYLVLDLLSLIYMDDVGWSAAGVYNRMHTLCILCEWHTCPMCTRSILALSLRDNAGIFVIS